MTDPQNLQVVTVLREAPKLVTLDYHAGKLVYGDYGLIRTLQVCGL